MAKRKIVRIVFFVLASFFLLNVFGLFRVFDFSFIARIFGLDVEPEKILGSLFATSLFWTKIVFVMVGLLCFTGIFFPKLAEKILEYYPFVMKPFKQSACLLLYFMCLIFLLVIILIIFPKIFSVGNDYINFFGFMFLSALFFYEAFSLGEKMSEFLPK